MEISPPVDLKVLYYFTILAEELHFGAAARRIGIEQPPLSLQIKKLEGIVGAQLFDRSSRKIRLTPVGEALLPEARKLLQQSIQLVDRLRTMGRGEAGVLHIGFATSTIFSGLTSTIQEYKKRYPGVELRLSELSSAAQMEALRNGRIDVGIIREAGRHDDMVCKEVIREKFIAVLSNRHPLAKQEHIRLRDIEGLPFVHFPRQVAPALYDKVSLLFAGARFEPHIVQEAFEWQTIVSLVEANLGISICPASFQQLKIGKVQYRPLLDVKTETTISVCHPVSSSSRLVAPFVQLMEEQALP